MSILLGEAALNDKRTITLTITNASDEAHDPTTIAWVTTKPDGTTVTQEKSDFANPSVGTYTIVVLFDVEGTWEFAMDAVSTGLRKVRSLKVRVKDPADL